MTKLSAEEAADLTLEFETGFGDLRNKSHSAIKKMPPGPDLLALIEKVEAKLAQYDSVLEKIGPVRAPQLQASHGDRVAGLREMLVKLREKQAKG